MKEITKLNPQGVFKYFNELTKIPRGSGNMEKISEYCMEFAKSHNLNAVKDEANNVIIYKDATPGYEDKQPVILQGHLDIVCQKAADYAIDFEKDGLNAYIDGDYITAQSTTLGADNGIAVAMILAILESNDIPHPPIEALFTTDEEIGLIGASALDSEKLKGKKMINIDAEDPKVLTVSCAGSSDFKMIMPNSKTVSKGTLVTISINGLKGGHSGIEIDKGKINANILMGRVLNCAKSITEMFLVKINGGDKTNAICNSCEAIVLTTEPDKLISEMEPYICEIKSEISTREPNAEIQLVKGKKTTCSVHSIKSLNRLTHILMCVPNGIMQMSADVEGLVETSLNLGILQTNEKDISLLFALRSNISSALKHLEERLMAFSEALDLTYTTSGHYPPWEFMQNSEMQKLYKEVYAKKFGHEPRVEAIHAGLECGVLSNKIKGLDCIAIGPEILDAHTINERLNIETVKDIYELVLNMLKEIR